MGIDSIFISEHQSHPSASSFLNISLSLPLNTEFHNIVIGSGSLLDVLEGSGEKSQFVQTESDGPTDSKGLDKDL